MSDETQKPDAPEPNTHEPNTHEPDTHEPDKPEASADNKPEDTKPAESTSAVALKKQPEHKPDRRSLFEKCRRFIPIKKIRNPPPTVSILPLRGVISAPISGGPRGGLFLDGLKSQIEDAFKPGRLDAVALLLNSPGGSPTQSDLIAREIRRKAKDRDVPVIAFCEDVAASGGYWLACAADEIFCLPTSVLGSIGVISASFGFTQAIEKLGVERRLFTAGEDKSLMDPFQPLQDKDVDKIKKIQADMHTHFIDTIKDRRGEKLEKAGDTDLFTGTFWMGRDAVDLGLADGIGTLDEELRTRFGEEVRFKFCAPKRSFMPRLSFGMQALVDGVADRLEQRAHWSRFGL
ncbi:MAG: S49 family peptidase [Alphaproteobacteria bacterium]